MTDYPAHLENGFSSNIAHPLVNPEYTTQARGPTVMTSAPVVYKTSARMVPSSLSHAPSISMSPVSYGAYYPVLPDSFWFEHVHVMPRSISFGNILASQTRVIAIFNAYRRTTVSFISFVNNAGVGVDITDLPTLPLSLPPLEGLLLTLEVTTDGAPSFRTTLDFEFDVSTSHMPVSGNRIVLFPFRPEMPVTERLRFLTDIMEHKDGTEQRVSLRKAPRQEFDFTLFREDGLERQKMENLLFEWQSQVFGIPIWMEPSYTSAGSLAGDASINVNTTDYADLRVGGLAMLYLDGATFEAAQITSIGPTSIEFASPLGMDWPAGTEVYPIRTAIASSIVQSEKYPKNLAMFTITFRVLDNDIDIGDASSFSSFEGLVLVDDANAIDATLPETMVKRVYEFDGDAGVFSQQSAWDRSRKTSSKGWCANSRQRLWQIRQLLHKLRGPQVSFYLPTFYQDITPSSTILSGSSVFNALNAGYARYVQNRSPKNIIRLWTTVGTSLTRTIVSSAEVDSLTEQITVDSPFPSNYLVSEVDRIELIEKVRIDSDDVTIVHYDSIGTAKIGFPVRSVLE